MSDQAIPLPIERAGRLQRFWRRRRRVLVALFALVACLLLFLWYIGVLGGNVRTVVPGRVYRSAQLTGGTLRDVLEKDRIRTVINLRGGTTRDAWYRSELAECESLGVRHVDIPMSAIHLPPPEELHRLLAAFDQMPYPILFHCQGGSDRSGLTGTIYLNIYRHVPLDQAETGQLTWRYGHFRWSRTGAMDKFFTMYRQTSGGLDLRAWIETRYPALYAALPASEQTTPSPEQKVTPAQRVLPSPKHTTGPSH